MALRENSFHFVAFAANEKHFSVHKMHRKIIHLQKQKKKNQKKGEKKGQKKRRKMYPKKKNFSATRRIQ